MKVDFMCRCFYSVYFSLVKKYVKGDKRKAVKKEYYDVFNRAGDIGADNRLLSAYALGAFFIAMCRKSGFDPEQCYEFLENGFRNNKLVRPFLGSGNGYFDEKKMISRRQWSKFTHEKHYENDWVVDIIENKDGKEDFVMGYDYLECGVCKMFKAEGCFQWAKYLCKLDFLLVEVIGIGLKRTTTIAEGGSKCDFRFTAAKEGVISAEK